MSKTMNKKYSYLSLALIATGPFCSVAIKAAGPAERLNVLFVMADDLRPELGCYGVKDIHTPNIDKFACNAMVFRNAYCNAPVSGASRASLLTGVYPNYPNRFTSYTCKASVDARTAIPLSGWLTSHGYHTVSNGKIMHHIEDHADSWSEKPWRYHPDGYDVYWAEYNKWELWLNSESGKHINPRTMRGPFCEAADVPDSAYDDGHVVKKTIADLRRLRDKGQPFFLACGFWKPHLPFCAPKKYWDLYPSVPMPGNRFRPYGLPEEVKNSNEINAYAMVKTPDDDEFLRTVKTGYYACVSYVDALFGELMTALDTLGLKDNTIVILLGDHGWNLGEHNFIGKHNLMDITTRVPLIIRVPGMQGGYTASMAELIDIYPTLCDLCHIPKPEKQLDGKSLLPVLKDPATRTKDLVYVQWEGGDDVLDPRYNYAQWSKSGHEMLFDHATDAQENYNQAGNHLYDKVRRKVNKKMKKIKRFAFRKHLPE
jgi:iduronate 2-sulfatase